MGLTKFISFFIQLAYFNSKLTVMNRMLNTLIISSTLLILNLNSYAQDEIDSIIAFEPYIEKVMNSWQVPHLAIGVVKDTQIIYMKGFGYRDHDKKLPVDENTLFKIASNTKPFTAMTYGIFADQKRFHINTPIINIVPNFKMYNDYVTKHITPMDLLTNRTGLPRHGFLWYGTNATRKDIANSLQYLQPFKSFRETHVYTNIMYDMVAYIIEEATGENWESYTKKYLLGPLNMHTTCFGTELFNHDNFAIPYNYDHKLNRFTPNTYEDIMYSNTNIPAGGINTSINEMCNWLIFNLNKGKFNGVQVVPENFVLTAHSVQQESGKIDYSNKTFQYGHGLGWYIENFHGRDLITFSGMTAGFNSRVMLFPKESLGIVLFIGNGISPSYIISQALAEKLILGEHFDWNTFGLNNPRWASTLKEEPEPSIIEINHIPQHLLNNYTGNYLNQAYGNIEVYLNENRLRMKRGTVDFELISMDNNNFKILAPYTMYMNREVTFRLNDSNKIIGLSVNFERQLEPILFTKQ